MHVYIYVKYPYILPQSKQTCDSWGQDRRTAETRRGVEKEVGATCKASKPSNGLVFCSLCKTIGSQIFHVMKKWVENRKKKQEFFFIFFGLGELWLQKIGPPTAKSLCHSEGQKQSVLKRCRCGVSETTPTMRCCPWFVAFLLDTFFLQTHWIYRWVFLWFGQFIEMSPYRKALLFLWGANPKAGSGSLHQGAIDSHLSLSNV